MDNLKKRNLLIKDEAEAETILKTENYYNIINGYKNIFLNHEETQLKGDDWFKDGTDFEELYGLFGFDRSLRNSLLRYLLIFETHFKSICAYRFSEAHRGEKDYLKEESYIKDKNKLKDVKKLIEKIDYIIEDKKEKEGHSIAHYHKKYAEVPLWVLVNDFTFGNISVFYSLLDDSIKNKIAKDFSVLYYDQYKEKKRITAKTLSSIAVTFTHFRNCCAHEMTLYNCRLYKRPASKELATLLTISESYFQINNLYSLYLQSKLILPKAEFVRLKSSLMQHFSRLEEIINEESYKKVQEKTGFLNGWDQLV